jgi:hypothetical protein
MAAYLVLLRDGGLKLLNPGDPREDKQWTGHANIVVVLGYITLDFQRMSHLS